MKTTLRTKFIVGFIIYTAVLYFAVGAGLYVFNQHEQRQRPEEIEEEQEELLIIYGIMAGALPIALAAAWVVSGRVLRPLRSMLSVADQIGAGRIDLRLESPVASDDLGHLAKTLNDAFDNYHRLLARVDRFSLDAAHQLRNPLAAMRTAAEVCLQKPRSPAEYVETISRFQDDARRLGHTVEQLLLLARLSSKAQDATFEPIDIAAISRDLVEGMGPAFEACAIRLESRLGAEPAMIRGSSHLIEQAIANLLDNALKLTPSGGLVSVELSRPSPHRIALAISDSGPGLSDAVKPGTLNPDSPAIGSRSKEGAGLGLLIVCNIVRAHGGLVQAAASESNGARFTIDLPELAAVRNEPKG